ncbi:MAG: alanine racemase [Candidatus Omnitrophica bacterium]|nr:alanine racemase [Candidatus Omnitrophota bacterium]
MDQPNGCYRPTWIEIDHDAIAQNYDLLRKRLHPKTKLLVPIKANAYGHGAFEVARALEAKGVAFFGVSSIDEAVALRQKGIRSPLLILNAILKEEIPAVFEHDLTQTVCSEEFALRLNQEAIRRKKRIPVHLKIDTGMGRLGVWYEEALAFARFVRGCEHLFMEGLYTHLADADGSDPKATRAQMRRFKELIQVLREEELLPPFVHLANSAAVLHFPESHFNLVRPGLAIYGIHPFYEKRGRLTPTLKPALTLKTRIVYLKGTPKGRKIGYGGTYTTKKETVIATLPIGYADGYNRLLSNQGKVLLRGQRIPITGRICMDQCMVDGGAFPDLKIGEEVVLIGRQGSEEIKVEEIATVCKTIPYEILCGLSNRVPRIYLNSPDPLTPSAFPLNVVEKVDR